MKTIWKFEIPLSLSFTIKMPIDAKILCIDVDQKNGCPCIWALVDSENKEEERFFELFGTGNKINEDIVDMNYIGTYQNTPFVWHIFERVKLISLWDKDRIN